MERIVRALCGALLLACCLTACGPAAYTAEPPAEEPAAEETEIPAVSEPEPAPEPEPVEIDYLAHGPYMQGQDGYFFPDRLLTWAETAQILVNLYLEPEATPEEITEEMPEEAPEEVPEEVPEESAEQAPDAEEEDEPEICWYEVPVALAADYLPGVAEGTFRPEASITLQELVTVLIRAQDGAEAPEAPAEPEETEAEPEPEPDDMALAAERGWIEAEADPLETVTRARAAAILNRVLGRTPDREALDGLDCLVFLDLDRENPDYYDVLECALPHEYLEEDGETWNPESLLHVGLRPGFHKAVGVANYVLEDGTVLREPGLFTAGADTYLVSENDGQVYADEALHVVDGKVVFVTADGVILKNDSWNDYLFDADGFYTTGDETLDEYVAQALEACTTGDMTREEKLRACYEYVRGFKYLGRNATLPSTVKTMPMENAVAYASKIFETGKGDCYNFAASFCFLARALGYEANTVVGSCGYLWSNVAVAHGWVEIVLDGETYLFDPQIENYNLRAGISNETHSAYQVTYGTAPGRYYKN